MGREAYDTAGRPGGDWPVRRACRRSTIVGDMRTYRYLHYDVFTDRALEGNQLAVFPEPAGLDAEDMQRVTREMNFSECTFIFPPEPPHVPGSSPTQAGAKTIDVRMRIFTPGEELPMAGHPTVGSTFALVKEGVIARGQKDFVFGLGVGPTPSRSTGRTARSISRG
jgi:trans-2,3-dihydro-3-hydroxyanthranilate isomerase